MGWSCWSIGPAMTCKKVLNAKLEDRGKRERPKLRWEGGQRCYVKVLRKRNWKNIARNRPIWETLLRKVMAQKGQFCKWWWWWWWWWWWYTLGQVFFKHFNDNHHSTNDPYSYVSAPETYIRVHQPAHFIKTLDNSYSFISDPASAWTQNKELNSLRLFLKL
jgi:hypothetical protein